MWLGASSCAPSSVCTITLIAPAAEQTSSIACGCTTGAATATPSDNRNHASTQRCRKARRRRVDMGAIMTARPPGVAWANSNAQVLTRGDVVPDTPRPTQRPYDFLPAIDLPVIAVDSHARMSSAR